MVRGHLEQRWVPDERRAVVERTIEPFSNSDFNGRCLTAFSTNAPPTQDDLLLISVPQVIAQRKFIADSSL